MDTPNPVCIVPSDPADDSLVERAKALATQWDLPFLPEQDTGLVLMLDRHQLSLKQLDEPKLGAVVVDFASDALTFRRLHGGGRKEAIAKAVGIKGQYCPTVLDATAGLGRDAFVLASLGCSVQMFERSNVVAALLSDGLARAAHQDELMNWLPQRMTLIRGQSQQVLANWTQGDVDVVYLDPMFPHRKKSALVKKDMRLFQQLLGPDEDADSLLGPALQVAKKRVVVKRPESAPYLDHREPNMAIKGKKHRFDVYLTNLK